MINLSEHRTEFLTVYEYSVIRWSNLISLQYSLCIKAFQVLIATVLGTESVLFLEQVQITLKRQFHNIYAQTKCKTFYW